MPEKAVSTSLASFKKPLGKTIMISIGKAAYTMAKQVLSLIDIDEGLVVTKYGHSKDPLKNTKIIESGHPLLDENSLLAANEAIKMVSNLNVNDTVIMLISGGGSSLFELPFIPLKKLQSLNDELIKSGANINEINIIRKRLSKVKGGKFGSLCYPAKVFNIILSDIINDPLDMIASGPTVPDTSSNIDAINIINKYGIKVDDQILELLNKKTTTTLNNIETFIAGNNEGLKLAAKRKAIELGYDVIYIDKPLTCDISEAVNIISSQIKDCPNNTAIIYGGEITLNVKGNGLGGRNQELALRMIPYINKDTCFFSVGSDGTDGPTDAAGAYVDFDSEKDINDYVNNNDAYHCFEKYGGLIKTGPTGTNVCDLYCVIKR